MTIILKINIPDAKVEKFMAEENITKEEFIAEARQSFLAEDPEDLCPGATATLEIQP